ncbi:MAG: hypothetical protein C0173_09810 [Desulfurella sp.]|uniref:hypothetical protein n=1 Tax=Desulfurella sp. TaxID=1962857 RepID=UPI000CB9E480|nr:hypothetical protein [Desulfurella sp.]PMP87186.1 MAG: hypothetical protein C0173_09810 [Desulfurella sp.]
MKSDPPLYKIPYKFFVGEEEVLKMEDWVTIVNLKKRNPNLGTRKIAEVLNVSRNAVKRALKSQTYPSYFRSKTAYKELEPFHEFIKESFVFKKQRVSVTISNLRYKGYKGSNIAVFTLY